jgi:hypothetical protein
VGANGTNNAVSGTNINGIGVNATFDVSRSAGTYTVTDSGDSSSNGQNYEVGDLVKILGTDLGGASPTNDILIQVTSIDSGGAIVTFAATGTSILGGATYNNVNSSSTTSIAGTAAQLSVARTGGTGAYAIALSSGGTGYLAGDTVTWSGVDFGGTSPANDIVIEVQGVTSGEIVDFIVTGTPVGATGDAVYPSETATNVATTGTSATFNVTRTDGVYTIAVAAGGSGYFAGNRIRILGTSLNGTSPLNDCVVTVGNVNTVGLLSGVISAGTGAGTPFAGDTITVYPTLSISEATTGIIANGTTLSVGAIATIQVDFATDHGLVPGTTILTSVSSAPAPDFASTLRTLPASGTWTGIAFSGDTFIAVLSGSNTSAKSINGQTWAAGGNLPSSTTWTAAAAGVINSTTYFVAVASGGTAAAFSTNGGTSWSAATLPTSATWSSVTYNNGIFVAVASGGTAAAYSITGEAWVASTLPSSSTWSDVAGGLVGTSTYFVAVASGSTAAAYSVDNGAS